MINNISVSQYNILKSRAEQTNYEETSRFQDIMNFLNDLQKKSDKISIQYFVKTSEGKDVPLVILAKNGRINYFDAQKLPFLKILICAGTHAGEVEGKEAGFAIINDILFGDLKYLLEKCIILYVPVFNADGNDKINRLNRISQNGPIKGVGESDVPSGININRDFSKLEIPETAALVENILNKWNPDIFIDCHTTNGSYHGYHLTYAPPLNPNTGSKIKSFLKNELFPKVTDILLKKYNYKIQYYGNFIDNKNPEKGWQTFDYLPRYSTNYIGMINRIAILSEAYSNLEFRKRIDVTQKFIKTILEFCYNNHSKIKMILHESDFEMIERQNNFSNIELGIKCRTYESNKMLDFYLGEVDKVKDPESGKFTYKMKEGYEKKIKVKDFTSFESVRKLALPYGYILPKKYFKIKENLLMHGINILEFQDSIEVKCQVYKIDSLIWSKSILQKHFPLKVKGCYKEAVRSIRKGDYFIPIGQIKSNLIFYLLEPESEDGYLFWNFFDEYFHSVKKTDEDIHYPVLRVSEKLFCPFCHIVKE